MSKDGEKAESAPLLAGVRDPILSHAVLSAYAVVSVVVLSAWIALLGYTLFHAVAWLIR